MSNTKPASSSDKEELTKLTDSIRGAWSWTNATSAEEEDANAEEFDDWLRRVRAEAWDEGRSAAYMEFARDPRGLFYTAVNPYRGFTPMEGTSDDA